MSSMKVRLLFFAHYRDLAGTGEVEVELPAGSTAGDLIRRVRERPGMESLPALPVVAVNEEYSSASRALADGDEVALLPPVAGG